jgi:stalled ribosome rescue protein Dom34
MKTDKSHPADDKHFFHEIAAALADVEEILVVGPASAKLELVTYLEHDSRGIAAKIVGVETMDHPTDGELIAHVKKHFRAVDRMRGTRP